MKIADLPKEAKPREKAFCYGIEELDDQELLALLIGSGVKGHSAIDIAKSLLETFITLPHLSQASLNALTNQRGLSKITALKLVAAFELHKRLNTPKYFANESIREPRQIAARFRYLETLDYESVILVMLNRKKEIIREVTKYKGTFDSCSFNFKEIMSDLFDSKCSSFILIHNHPDGSSKPSENDILTTSIIRETASSFGIELFDHVIIFKNGYYSFRENNHFSEI